jgi:Gluconate 2-dehydrogenase subunit 3
MLDIVTRPKLLSPDVSRREMLRNLASIAAAMPFIAAAHPIHKHLVSLSSLEAADASRSAANWNPLFLNAEQASALLTLSERIVPGAAAAEAHRFIDLLLSVDTTENQQNFIQALQAIDAASDTCYEKHFRLLTPDQQAEILTQASTMMPAHESSTADAAAANGPRNLRDHFDHLKGWISLAYYSSEAGMTELGWTSDRVFNTFPFCTHPDGHF